MAKFCSWCGEPLEPGARYCAECGARVLETVKVDGKGESDPMRGLDIVAGRPIPAGKTVRLDRETLEALKLRDGLPGDDEPDARVAKAGETVSLNHAAPSATVALPEVLAVPEVLKVPEVPEDLAEAEEVADGRISEAGVDGDVGSDEAQRAEGDADSGPDGPLAEPSDSNGESGGSSSDVAVAEPVLQAPDESAAPFSDSDEPDNAEGGGEPSATEGEGGSSEASQVEEIESNPEASGPEADAADRDDAAGGEDAPCEPQEVSAPEPADDLPKPDDSEEEYEVVPVIPREAQAAAAKQAPMSFDGTDTLVLPSDAEPKHFGLERPDLEARKRKRMLIALCCVIAVLAVAACVLAYYRFGGQADTQQSQQQAEQTQSSEAVTLPDESEQRPVVDGPGEDGQSEQLAQEETAPTDEQIFQTLTSAYNALEGYSDRIVDCVDDFNGMYMARSMDDRTAAKEKADKVKADLEAAKAEIESLKVGANSPYATDEANMVELYDCQIGRISSLCDAWAVSVCYDVPSQHQDEILAALSASYEGGNNVYLERFDELYWNARPVHK